MKTTNCKSSRNSLDVVTAASSQQHWSDRAHVRRRYLGPGRVSIRSLLGFVRRGPHAHLQC